MSTSNLISDSESRLKAIIDTAVDGIITINDRGVIETLNPAAARLFGYEEEELVGKNISLLMPEPDRSKHDKYISNYHHSGEGKIIGKGREVIGKKRDGTTFPFLLSISEVQLKDRKIFTGIVHDISELRKVKDALKKEIELNELKSRFVTMASHEFRTPLSTILSSVSLISKYNAEEDQEKRLKHVNRIKSSVANLTGILNDFLSLSRLEEGKVSNTPVSFNIKKLADEVMDEINPLLKEGQGIKFEFFGEKEHLILDRNMVKNIFINLLSNASKYSSENKLIDFTISVYDKQLDIVVKDYGIGIPEEDKGHLFSRFFRAHNAQNIQGTGLGLNIVKKYVDFLEGEISFISELNKGTTFSISIPIH